MLQTEIIAEWMMLYRTAGVVHFWWWNVNNKVKKNWIFVLAVWAWDKACSFVGQKKVDFGRSTDIFSPSPFLEGKNDDSTNPSIWRLNQSIDIFNGKKKFTVSIIPWIYFEFLDDGLRPCLHRCPTPIRDPSVKSCNTSLFGPISPPPARKSPLVVLILTGYNRKKESQPR